MSKESIESQEKLDSALRNLIGKTVSGFSTSSRFRGPATSVVIIFEDGESVVFDSFEDSDRIQVRFESEKKLPAEIPYYPHGYENYKPDLKEPDSL